MKFFGIFSSEPKSRPERSSTIVDATSNKNRGTIRNSLRVDSIVNAETEAETVEQLRREVRKLKQENEELRKRWKEECVRGNDLARKLCEASKEKHALRKRITTIKQKSEENLVIEQQDFYSKNEETESAGNSRTNSSTQIGKQSPFIPPNNL